MRKNTVKLALAEGKLQLGTGFGQLRSQEIATILAAAGFHWAFLDTEHGGFDLETVQDICRLAVMVGLSPIVRVADLQYSLIARALDCGAQGVIFPRVESPELLQKAISWTKFPPLGIRGYGLGPVNVDYEKADFPQVIEHMNANTMVVMQIETRRALDMREELLAVPGVDAVMVGPADLSISLACPVNFSIPRWSRRWKPFATPASAAALLRARRRARRPWRVSGRSGACAFSAAATTSACCSSALPSW